MGKIVALGGGCYRNDEIVNIMEYIISLTGKAHPHVLYLPTAGHDDISDEEPLKNLFERCGATFSHLLLTLDLPCGEISGQILGADIIYVGGGNVQFMMDTWRKTGADEYLTMAYKQGKVMSGLSAGAVCWFQEAYDDCGENGSFVFCDCLGILPFCACPHYEDGPWNYFKEAIKTRGISGVGMENGAALTFVDGVFGVMCGNEGGEAYVMPVSEDYKEQKLARENARIY